MKRNSGIAALNYKKLNLGTTGNNDREKKVKKNMAKYCSFDIQISRHFLLSHCQHLR